MTDENKKSIAEKFRMIHNGCSNQIVRVAEQLEGIEWEDSRRIAYILTLYKDDENKIQLSYDLLADGEFPKEILE